MGGKRGVREHRKKSPRCGWGGPDGAKREGLRSVEVVGGRTVNMYGRLG